MKIKLYNKSDYDPIIEMWAREFYAEMDEEVLDGECSPGDESGIAPDGVKIIFDGYGYNEVTNDQDNFNMLSFAVFVHKTSLTEEFPPHDLTPWALIHRPKEEVCIYVWYDVENDDWEIIPFEDNNDEVDADEFIDLIHKIAERDGYELEYEQND